MDGPMTTTSGAMLTMPMILINMGGEMLYVLDQRLKAQNIAGDKSVKVLVDVVKTMYNTKFISELFKPHHMYSNVSTRQIFDRLAHSSIMRLNQSSMDKLYGLMRMGFKYNILACSSADQLVQVTMNHLRSIKEIVPLEEATVLIEDAIVLTANTYGNMSHGNFLLLKQSLCRFFQDVRIKVSLFLQSEIQNGDGSFVIRSDGQTATGGDVPGTIRYYSSSGKLEDDDTVELNNARGAIPYDDKPILSRDPSLCPYGENLYIPNAKPGLKSVKTGEEMAADAKKAGAKGTADSDKAPAKQWKATASDGLNLLADLLGTKASADVKPWKINLFSDEPFDEDDKGLDPEVETIMIDAMSDRKTLLDDFDDKPKAQGKKGDEDDLLSLMDST